METPGQSELQSKTYFNETERQPDGQTDRQELAHNNSVAEHFLRMLTDQMPSRGELKKSFMESRQSFVLSNPASLELVRPSETANLTPQGNELTLVKR